MRRAFVRRFRHWLANRGWWRLARHAGYVVRWKARAFWGAGGGGEGVGDGGDGETADMLSPLAVHPFDERHGVETGGLIWSESLGSGEQAEYWATGYYGIAPSVLWQALDRLGLEWERFTFVDIGSGKGRGVMLALRYPFRAVLGVELSPELTRVAKENLQRFRAEWRTGAPAEVMAGDATKFALPDGSLVLYLYHPFAAPMMEVLLARVREAIEREPREVYLLYMNPELDGRLSGMPFLTRMWREGFLLSEEDVRADRFGSRQEYVSAYRFGGDGQRVG